jgi:N-acetylneuraminic acid mutarotase
MGTVYQHTFTQPGSYSYHCLAHCILGMTGVVNVSGSCTPSGWSAGPDMPTPLVRAVGVFFQADGNFYTVGGRTADTAGSDFQHVLRYSPTSNAWTQRAVTLPDNQMNNMACGVLAVAGTPSIYCVSGSAAGQTTAAGRVFSYNPVTDTSTTLTGDDWPGAMGTILPGGFAVAGNKLYILGGFNINVASTNQIWQFDPTAAVGAKWTMRMNTPEGIMYAPTCSIGGNLYVGGASDYQGGTVVDTTNSFSFNPVANTIGTITAIPRATGETRGLAFNDQMYVMGGGRVAPNPSTEVDIYNPGTNSWTMGAPFTTARRNFPTDTDGTTRIWLAGGYASDGVTPLSSMEIFCNPGAPSPTPTATPTATATATATAATSPTGTPTPTATATPTSSVSPSPTPTATGTPSPTPRTTPTPRPRPTPAPRP